MKPRQKSIAIVLILSTLVAGISGVLGNYLPVDVSEHWQPFLWPLFILILIALGIVAVWQWMQGEQSDPPPHRHLERLMIPLRPTKLASQRCCNGSVPITRATVMLWCMNRVSERT